MFGIFPDNHMKTLCHYTVSENQDPITIIKIVPNQIDNTVFEYSIPYVCLILFSVNLLGISPKNKTRKVTGSTKLYPIYVRLYISFSSSIFLKFYFS